MWAVYKLEAGRRLWYCGIKGQWSGVEERACRWFDKRDAQAASVYVRGFACWVDAEKAIATDERSK
jgi:hypothetical protein